MLNNIIKFISLLLFLLVTTEGFCGRTTQVLNWGERAMVTTATRYFPPMGANSLNATQNTRQCLFSTGGYIQGFRGILDTDPGASSQNYAFTVMKNGSTTTLSCTINGDTSGFTCQDQDSDTVSAGDLIGIRVIPSSPAPGASNGSTSLRFLPTTAGYNNYCSSFGTQPASGSIFYTMGLLDSSTTEADSKVIMPTSGTFRNLYVNATVAPNNGAGTQTWTIDFRKDTGGGSADCGLTTTLSETATTNSDTTNTCSVNAGDLVNFEVSASAGTPITASELRIGVTFVPTVEGEFVHFMNNETDALNTGATEYASPFFNNIWQGTEGAANQISQYLIVKAIYGKVSVAPGVGKSWVFTLRDDAVNTSHTFTISDAETTDNSSAVSAHTVADSSLLSISLVPSGTPSAANGRVSTLMYIPPRRLF